MHVEAKKDVGRTIIHITLELDDETTREAVRGWNKASHGADRGLTSPDPAC